MADKIRGIFEPFDLFVSKQLSIRKQIMFSGNKSNRPELFHTYTTAKQGLIRMASGVDISPNNELLDYDEEGYIGSGLARHWVLEGGIYDETPSTWGKTNFDEVNQASVDARKSETDGKARGTFNPKTKKWEYTAPELANVTVGDTQGFATAPRGGIGERGAYGDPSIRSNKDGDFGIVPMPGITDATIRTKSDDGSLREAEVNFVCHNRRQLEILEALYMRPGYVILLEWGWNPYISNDLTLEEMPGVLNDFFLPHSNLNTLNETIKKRKQASGGNYDGFVGYCRNFTFKANGSGGYECKTEIIAQGELLESLKSATVDIETEDSDGNITSEEIDRFLYYLRSIDTNLNKAGDAKYIKLYGTEDSEETYYEKSDWDEIMFDVAATVGVLTGYETGVSALYLMGRASEGGFSTEDNISDEKIKQLNKTEIKYILGFEHIIDIVQDILKTNNEDLDHDAKLGFGTYSSHNIDSLLFGTILKEVSQVKRADGVSDTGGRKNIYVRWDLLCEIINRKCTPLYKTKGGPVIELTYQTPMAKASYPDEPNRFYLTGSNGQPKYAYLPYSRPRPNPVFTVAGTGTSLDKKQDTLISTSHKNLGQSYDNNVCLMPHQEGIRHFVIQSDEKLASNLTTTTDEAAPVFRLDPEIMASLQQDMVLQSDNTTVNYDESIDTEADGESVLYEGVNLNEFTEDDLENVYEGPAQPFEPLTQNKGVQYGEDSIGLIYFNLKYLITTYERMRFETIEDEEEKKVKRLKEKFSFFDFINTIWSDVNDSCGGYYDFGLHTEHERPHVVRIIDMTYQGSIEKNKPIFQFEPQSLRSITRDFYFSSKIDNDFAATVSIAAQSPNEANSLDAVSFKAFHRNIKNRFTDDTRDEKQKAKSISDFKKTLKRDLEKYNRLTRKLDNYTINMSLSWYLDEYRSTKLDKNGNFGTITSTFGPENAKIAAKKIRELIISINQRYPLLNADGSDHPRAGQYMEDKVSSDRNAIIPLEFNIKMDGIAGIIPLNVFQIDPQRLPLGYQREDIVFIVKGETQNITAGQDWTTDINGQLTLLDIHPNTEGTNPIPKDGETDPNENEGNKIDKKKHGEMEPMGPLAGLKNPLEHAIRITSPWGKERNNGSGRHKGIDLGAKVAGVSGDNVISPADGTVVVGPTISSGACGGTMTIEHPGGIKTRYCHLKEFKVSSNETVTQGQVIAIMGGDINDVGRGSSTATHLHYEVYDGSANPDWWGELSSGNAYPSTNSSDGAKYLS